MTTNKIYPQVVKHGTWKSPQEMEVSSRENLQTIFDYQRVYAKMIADLIEFNQPLRRYT
jgi:hypothetical protein